MMRWFTLASALTFGLVALAAWWFSRHQHNEWSSITAAILGVSLWPWALTVLAASLVQTLRPRRIFSADLRQKFAPFVCGLVLSVAGAAAVLIAITLLDIVLPKHPNWDVQPGRLLVALHENRSTLTWIAIALTSFLFTAVLLSLFTRRVRQGCCPCCGYNLSTITPAARGLCPECGHDQFALRGETAPRSPQPISP